MISTSGLNKADVLAVLFNAAQAQGLGFLQHDVKSMDQAEAQAYLNTGRRYFDYIKGRVLKIDLSDDQEFDERLYDRDNRTGTAADAIRSLRENK